MVWFAPVDVVEDSTRDSRIATALYTLPWAMRNYARLKGLICPTATNECVRAKGRAALVFRHWPLCVHRMRAVHCSRIVVKQCAPLFAILLIPDDVHSRGPREHVECARGAVWSGPQQQPSELPRQSNALFKMADIYGPFCSP